MSKQKILLTGSAGFVFSNFIRKTYYDKKYTECYAFISIDKLLNPHANDSTYVNRDHQFYIGDITDSYLIDKIFQIHKPDIVIHTAAESLVTSSITNPQLFVKSNVVGSQVLIDAAVKYKIKKFVYTSTDEVYGHLTSPEDPAFHEDDQCLPRNAYSASKYAAELLLKAAHNVHGLDYQITRSSNIFGPRQPNRNLLPITISKILNNQPIPLHGDGLHSRSWIHVNDFYSAFWTILEKGQLNQVYNISTDVEKTNLDMVKQICDVCGRGRELISFIKDRPGNDRRYRSNFDKLKDLGWTPEGNFDDQLAETVSWYKANSWFLKE